MVPLTKNNKGVTLIELVVSVGIFAVIMVSATGIFSVVLEGQRNALASQNIQESLRYALEVISKEIRMAQAGGASCGFGTNKIYNQNSDRLLQFLNKDGICTTYRLTGGRFRISRGAENGFLTPANTTISKLQFDITDENTSQSKVTVLIDAYINTGKAQHRQDIKLQTTISSRYYE